MQYKVDHSNAAVPSLSQAVYHAPKLFTVFLKIPGCGGTGGTAWAEEVECSGIAEVMVVDGEMEFEATAKHVEERGLRLMRGFLHLAKA